MNGPCDHSLPPSLLAASPLASEGWFVNNQAHHGKRTLTAYQRGLLPQVQAHGAVAPATRERQTSGDAG